MAGKLKGMTPLSVAFRRPRSLQVALLTFGVLASTGFSPVQAQVSSFVANGASARALPSGLSPVSELVVAGSQLALDSNGTLYRSDDHGKRWHPIKQQWDGKAVELLGIPGLTSAPKSGQVPRSDADQETYAAVLLKSTTALHWVSVDRGKTWTPSSLDDVRRNDIKWSGQ
jgi:BNR/Asp-box repeat